jgi:hypothetical protein
MSAKARSAFTFAFITCAPSAFKTNQKTNGERDDEPGEWLFG